MLFLYRQIVSIKAGEKIINGNMIKRNEDFKNKRTKRKKTVYLIKAKSVLCRRGGRHIEKKILKNKIIFFF